MRTTIALLLLGSVLAACATGTAGEPTATEAPAPAAVPTSAPTPGPTTAATPAPAVTPRPAPTPTPTPAPLCPPADETTFDANQIVLATANIFGAGRDLGPAPGGGGRGTLPPVWTLEPGTTEVSVACAMGSVIPIRQDNVANGAAGDGTGPTDIESFEGISGIVHEANGMFLTGVFLSDAVPADPAPERLDFTSSEAFESLAPEIGQTFYVGDGVGRRFAVPDGATRLFLGFADAAAYQGAPGWYGNNVGYLDVTVEVSE